MMKKAAERKQNLMTILVVLMVFAAVVFMGSVLTASADTEADAHLVQNMQKVQKTVDMSGYQLNFTGDAAKKEGQYIFQIQLENPELFYVSSARGWAFYRKNNGDVTKVQVGYTMSGSEAAKAKVQFDNAVSRIVKKAEKKSSQRAQVEVVNNEIKKATEYDYSYARKNRYNAYGALVEGKAVCMGYATAFKAAMDRLGISNGYRLNRDGSHIWNTVRIGGKTLNVDVTWNDTTRSNRYLLTKSHTTKAL